MKSQVLEIGKEYDVEGQKVIYMGKTDLREFFLSVGESGAIIEHVRDLEGKVERKTYSEGPQYDMLMKDLEEIYK